MFYQWFAVTLVYYGLSYSSTDLAGDPYTNFCSSVAIEIPGLFLLVVRRRDKYISQIRIFISFEFVASFTIKS